MFKQHLFETNLFFSYHSFNVYKYLFSVKWLALCLNSFCEYYVKDTFLVTTKTKEQVLINTNMATLTQEYTKLLCT